MVLSRIFNWEPSRKTHCHHHHHCLENRAPYCPVMMWAVSQSHPWEDEQRPEGVCLLWRLPGSGRFKAWTFPWLFGCENLRMCLFSHNRTRCPLPFFSSRLGRGFPGLTNEPGEGGFVTRGLLYCRHPSSQAGPNCHSTDFPGVSGTFLRAYIIFVTSKNPS